MSKKTQEDINISSQKKEINKKKRKEVLKLHKLIEKAEREVTPAKKQGISRKTAIKKINSQRRIGVLTMRESKYPKEFTLYSHNIFLNPLKKLIRGEEYKNIEHQKILIGIIQDFMRQQEMQEKAATTVTPEEVIETASA